MTVPRQLLVRSPKARNKITTPPHDPSLFDTRAALPETGQVSEKDDLHLFDKREDYDDRFSMWLRFQDRPSFNTFNQFHIEIWIRNLYFQALLIKS